MEKRKTIFRKKELIISIFHASNFVFSLIVISTELTSVWWINSLLVFCLFFSACEAINSYRRHVEIQTASLIFRSLSYFESKPDNEYLRRAKNAVNRD